MTGMLLPLLDSVFSPSQIAGLKLWLDASKLTGFSDADPVGTWPDLSGNGNDLTQGTAANKPLYKVAALGGKPALRFDGNDSMACADGAQQKPVTLAAVINVTNVTGASRTVFGASAGGGLQFRVEQTTAVLTMNKQSLAAIGSSASAIALGAPVVVVATYDGAGNWAFYANGTLIGSGNTAQTLTVTTTTVGYNTASGGSEFFLGDMAELLKYDSVLSGTDRNRVLRYLGKKYAVAIS